MRGNDVLQTADFFASNGVIEFQAFLHAIHVEHFEHRVGELVGGGFRQLSCERFIQLRLENFLGLPAVNVGGFANRAAHRFEHHPIERLTYETIKRFA